jgi:hypothetical protein
MPDSNPWSSGAFKNIVGRDPTKEETDFYSPLSTWETDVKNATGGGAPTTAGQFGTGYDASKLANNNTNNNTGTPSVNWGSAPSGDTRSIISTGIKQAYGRDATDQDYQYWEGKWQELQARGQQLNDPNYAWKRLIGMDASGADAAKFGPYAGGGGGGYGAYAGTSGAPGAAPQAPQPAAEDPRIAQFYADLMKRSSQPLTADRSDPVIRAQADANAANVDKQQRDYLANLAEKAGPLANLSGEARLANERSGQAKGSFEASIMQHEIDAKRQEVQNALTQQWAVLSEGQRLALQQRLADLDRAQQASQFSASMGQNESQFARQLANNAYQFDSNDQYRHDPISWS